MKPEIKYIELKSGYSHNGPAWIGLVSFSKSGRTLYFNGKAFQRIGSDRMRGNFYDVETVEEYWISGIKKDMTDRHQFGKGKILIEERVLDDYLTIINQTEIDKSRFEICTVIEESAAHRFNEMENYKDDREDEIDNNLKLKNPSEMTEKELDYFIGYYESDAINGRYLKGRKYSRNKMNELLAEKDKRILALEITNLGSFIR